MATKADQIREFVEIRADGRCEYCRRYQEPIGKTFFEVEHIIAKINGGLTIPANLALACRRYNLFKSVATHAIDPRTQKLTALFHPRLDLWHDHFRCSRDLLRIYGRTPIGRATVALLRLNDPNEQRARRIQRDYLADVFPLD